MSKNINYAFPEQNKEEFIKLLNFKINSSLKLKESIKLSKQIEKNKINKFLLKQYKNTVDHNTLFSKADSSSKINLCK